MKKALGLLAVILVAVAYVAGLWPERERRLALQGEVGMLQSRLEDAEVRLRRCGLLTELQSLIEVVVQKNYGQAQPLSSRFFDHARAEASRTAQPGFKDSLEAVLRTRDAVTTALAQGDPAALEQLKQAEARLKAADGYAAPAAGAPLAPTPATTPAATPVPSPET